MSETVTIQFDGKAENLLRAYEKLQEQSEKVIAGLKEQVEASRKAGDAGEDAGDAMSRGMISAQATIELAKKALEAVNAEWEKLRRNEREATDDAVRFGQAMRDVQLNLPDTLRDPESLFKGIAGRTGAAPSDIVSAAGAAFSARGSLSDEQTLATIEAAYTLNPRNAQQSNIVSSLALDLMKSGEVSDPRAAIGFISNIQQAMRLEDISMMSPTFGAMTNLSLIPGNTREEAAEIIATVQQTLGDRTGERSATGAVNFANRLQGFPGLEGDTQARIAQLQADPALRQKFLDTVALDAGTGNVFRSWISGDQEVMRSFSAAREQIQPLDDTQVANYQAVLQRRGANQSDRIVDLDARQQTAEVVSNLDDQRRQIIGQATAVFDAALEDVNLVGIDRVESLFLQREADLNNRDPAVMASLLRRAATQTDIFFGSMNENDQTRLNNAAARLDEAARELKSVAVPPAAPVAELHNRDR